MQWVVCRTFECGHEVYACDRCVAIVGQKGLVCETCWSASDKSCILCHHESAQNSRDFLRCCRTCFAAHFVSEEDDIVARESRVHLAKISVQQSWRGDEPALQLLLLPSSSGPSLPAYNVQPEYIDPSHCRLCLAAVKPTLMKQHLREKHGMTYSAYRREVLEKVLSEWPQRISSQVLRSRLAAFKKALCDVNFAELPCASCCRLKRKCKLSRVTFPPVDSEEPPSWLSWSREEWCTHRAAWFAAVDDVLNVENYLEHVFKVSERIADATKEVMAFEEDNALTSVFDSVGTASAWKRRVERWVRNLRRDMRSDAILAPGRSDAWWLLYSSSNMSRHVQTGVVECSLCKSCCHAFSRIAGKSRRPDVRMPVLARANGMWRGPDPVELSVLSYTETKVINLARVYVSVKRFFFESR